MQCKTHSLSSKYRKITSEQQQEVASERVLSPVKSLRDCQPRIHHDDKFTKDKTNHPYSNAVRNISKFVCFQFISSHLIVWKVEARGNGAAP